MNHTLVTFLGRTRQDPNTGYQRAKYRFTDEDAPRETPFFGMALAGHLRPDAAVILGTSGSQWSVLVEHLAQGDEVETARLELLDAETHSTITQSMLDDVAPVMSRAVGLSVTPRLIPFGQQADEQYEILGVIADTVPNGDVSIDLTHGFRHLGMVGFLSAFMLERVRNLHVRGLWYGALDMTDRTSGITPVFQLDGLTRVRRWVDALDRFDATGDYGVFAPLLIEDGVAEDKAGCLARAAFFERTQNLSDAARQLRTFLPILDTPLTGAAGLFQTRLAERLRWIKAGGLADHQRKLAFEHLKRRDFLRAAVFGWEALHTLECERHGLPSDDYSTGRKLAMDRLDEEMHAGEHPEWKKSAFLLLRDVRNALAHGNPPRHRRSRQVLGTRTACGRSWRKRFSACWRNSDDSPIASIERSRIGHGGSCGCKRNADCPSHRSGRQRRFADMRKPNPTVRPEDARTAWDAAQSSAASAPVTVRCKLMTPMYGGGVEPGEVDCAMPIRPSAIRGQLRFWWRLLNGVGLRPQDVFAAESDLWGGIATTGPRASRVAVDVAAEPVGSAATVKARHRRFPAYAFILERDDDPTLLGDGYEFILTLRFAGGLTEGLTDAQREQVIEALRWWASFGGIGARTRRGLGTVKISGGDVRLKPVTCKEVESRGGRMVLRGARKSAIEAWKDALEALKNFRQGESLGRNRGGGQRPGRSRWPEPDAIRHATGDHAPGHEPKRPVVGQYPRAAFGLPIVFQFKNKNQGDPKGPKGKGLTLNAAPVNTESNKKLRRDRMASPLILRPYFEGARYQPLALLLPGWESHVSVPVALDSTHLGPAWPEDSRERERLADLVPPMQGRGTDALTAFLHYFEHPAPTGGGQGGR